MCMVFVGRIGSILRAKKGKGINTLDTIPKKVYTKYYNWHMCQFNHRTRNNRNPAVHVKIRFPCRGSLTSAGTKNLREHYKKQMFKTSIAAIAAAPLLASGAAFAGPYVNIEANGSYPDGTYTSGNVEIQIGYEGNTPGGLNWYVSGGPTVAHTESTDDFGDVELAGYIGGSKGITEKVSAYGEIYGATNDDDLDFSGKIGARYAF